VRVNRQEAERLLLVVGAACLCLLLGVGAATAGTGDYRYKIVPADRAMAKLAVLKSSDFEAGLGWTGGPTKPARNAPDCPQWASQRGDLVITGEAESRFDYSGGGYIESSAGVFRTVAMLEKDWNREGGNSALLACLRADFDKWAKKDGSGRLVSFKRLAFPKTGSHTNAFRGLIRFQKGGGVWWDVIQFTSGRTVCTLGIALPDSPEAPSLLLDVDKHFVGVLASRMAVVI
jgi:hypothetical protein